MPATFEQLTKEAMDLLPRQKLALAEFLPRARMPPLTRRRRLHGDAEIREGIQAIDEGRVVGVPYEDVIRSAEARLVP